MGRIGDRQEQRPEDAPRRPMVSGERSGDAAAEILVDLERIGVANAPGSHRELQDLADDLG